MKYALVAVCCTLGAPSISLAIDSPLVVSGAQTDVDVIKWEWSAVEGAIEYELTVDGVVAGNTESLQWISEGLWVGDHSLTVKAIDETGERSQQSPTVKIYLQQDAVNLNSQESVEGLSGDVRSEEVDDGLIDPRSYEYPEVSDKAGYELVFSDEFKGDALSLIHI